MPSNSPRIKPVRVWCDGCFDLVHYGHANSMRQAKQMGDVLVVGVHNDKDIAEFKGPSIFTEDERYKMIRAIKWVDELVEGSTYWPTVETLEEHNCDFAAHGDDISVASNGKDPYEALWKAGKLKFYKRTEGVSTTDIVNRMLNLTMSHHRPGDCESIPSASTSFQPSAKSSTRISKFLVSSRKIVQFSNEADPKRTDKIVYVSGDFDLLHPGHLDFLEKVRQEGDYLIVGVHTDQVINSKKGGNYPIMNLHERTLSLLASKYVDEVVIGAPYHTGKDLLDHFKIDLVCQGYTNLVPDFVGHDPYKEAKERGIFKLIDSGNKLTTSTIVERIKEKREQFEERNEKKQLRENNFETFESKFDKLSGMADDQPVSILP